MKHPLGVEAPKRVRLRPRYDPDELAAIYDHDYDHTRWPDHVQRVAATVELALRNLGARMMSIADLSAGDGAIPQAIAATVERVTQRTPTLILGDLTPRWALHGPIEETLELLIELGRVDLFVLSETLEHLDDPDAVLARVRQAAHTLLLSTPVGECDTTNPEHYWGWNIPAIRGMLLGAAWRPLSVDVVRTEPSFYDYQVWTAA